jgi:hypothetical protein
MTLDISAIRQRIEKATPGEWEVELDSCSECRKNGESEYNIKQLSQGCHGQFTEEVDADLIAHAPADLRALCDEVERLTEKIEEQRYFYEDLCTKLVSENAVTHSVGDESPKEEGK